MSRSTVERLRDARMFAHHGEYAVLGLGSDTFSTVVEVKFTVCYSLIGIGEALKDIDSDVLAAEPNISWESIVAMRNRLVHTYWRIDDDIVYEVATMELHALGLALDRMIKTLA